MSDTVTQVTPLAASAAGPGEGVVVGELDHRKAPAASGKGVLNAGGFLLGDQQTVPGLLPFRGRDDVRSCGRQRFPAVRPVNRDARSGGCVRIAVGGFFDDDQAIAARVPELEHGWHACLLYTS